MRQGGQCPGETARTSARRRWGGHRPVPPTPLLHQPGNPDPEACHRRHHRGLSGGTDGGPGGYPFRRAGEAVRGGRPWTRPAPLVVIAARDDVGLYHIAPALTAADQPDLDVGQCTLDERAGTCVDPYHLRPPLGSWRGLRPVLPMLDRIREVLGRCGPVSSTAISPRFSLPQRGREDDLTFAHDFGPDPAPSWGGVPAGAGVHLHLAKAQAPRQRTR